jgi:hypothetical protein
MNRDLLRLVIFTVVCVTITVILLILESQALNELYFARSSVIAERPRVEWIRAQAALDKLQLPLDSFWNQQLELETDGWQQFSPEELELPIEANISVIYIGRCPADQHIYLYAIERARTIIYSMNDEGAFLRSSATEINSRECVPSGYQDLYHVSNLAGDWHYGLLDD